MTPDPSVNIDRLSPVLVRNMPVGLVIFDAKARIHSHNPLFAVMFGNMMDTGDHTIGELIEPGALGSFLEEFSALVKDRQDSLEMTCRYRAADGSHEKWMHIHVVPLPSASMPGPTEDLFYAIIDDVTNNIDENQRLLREKELAIQATRSKSSFLATMSHEIRTPIHTITGMTGLLADTVLDDEQQEYTTQIRFSAEILLGLINDILDISKIEAGRLSLEIIEFDLIKAIEESVDMQSLAAFT
jgi:PAS domain S-box-containing protein